MTYVLALADCVGDAAATVGGKAHGLGRLLEGPAMFGDRVTEESRRRALAAIDRIAEAVSMYGPDGVLEHVNPAWTHSVRRTSKLHRSLLALSRPPPSELPDSAPPPHATALPARRRRRPLFPNSQSAPR